MTASTFARRHVDIWPWTAVYDSSGGITRTNDSLELGMGRMFGTDGTVNNYISWHVAVDAGTWTLTSINYGSSNRGIVTWSLAGSSLGTLDQYFAAGDRNMVQQITGFTVSTAGVHLLKAQVLSKHASSSDYYQSHVLITLTRTGA